MPFQKGNPKPLGSGRKKGQANGATREWKDFVCAVARDVKAQDRLKEACLERPELLLKVAEHAVGKPKEQVELKGEFRMIQWPDNEDIPEE